MIIRQRKIDVVSDHTDNLECDPYSVKILRGFLVMRCCLLILLLLSCCSSSFAQDPAKEWDDAANKWDDVSFFTDRWCFAATTTDVLKDAMNSAAAERKLKASGKLVVLKGGNKARVKDSSFWGCREPLKDYSDSTRRQIRMSNYWTRRCETEGSSYNTGRCEIEIEGEPDTVWVPCACLLTASEFLRKVFNEYGTSVPQQKPR
jgi:hypothetical protein